MSGRSNEDVEYKKDNISECDSHDDNGSGEESDSKSGRESEKGCKRQEALCQKEFS